MFADQVAEAHKEEPSMLRRALRAISPVDKRTEALNRPIETKDTIVEEPALKQLAGALAPTPDKWSSGDEKGKFSDVPRGYLEDLGGVKYAPKMVSTGLQKLANVMDALDPGEMNFADSGTGFTDAIPKRTKEGMVTSVYGDPSGSRKGKRDIRAEAAKQYAFLKNRDFDVVESPDNKNEYAADLFTPTPDNKTGRQQFRIYQPDRVREVDVAHALLQRDPEMDKVLKKISPAYIKSFGGEDKVRYFLARHAVGGYSADEENEIAHATDNPPLKELAYLRNYARTGKTVSPVDELKKARGQL